MALLDTKPGPVSDLDTPTTDPSLTRRKFLQWGIYAIGGALTVAIGAPVVLYFINPAFSGGENGKILVNVGAPADFANQTTPKAVILNYKYTDTFKEAEGSKTVFVRAKVPNATNPNDFQVLDSTCTHAGCAVSFNPKNAPPAAQGKFYCPCHGSIFSVDGKNEAVAPRPLGSYTVSSKDGKLAIDVFEVKA